MGYASGFSTLAEGSVKNTENIRNILGFLKVLELVGCVRHECGTRRRPKYYRGFQLLCFLV